MTMGFLEFKKCLSSPNHLIKLLVVIGCICFSVYQVGKCVEKLLDPPITTYYGFRLNESMSYPSVTICRRPGFKTQLFPKYGLRRLQNLLMHRFFQHFRFDNYTIKDFLNGTTYGFEDVFYSYAYNGDGAELAKVDWKTFETVSHGKCFTVTPRVQSSTYSIGGGLWFYLNHDMLYRLVDSYGVSQYGFHVYVHDSNEVMTAETEQDNNFLEYIYVEANEDIRLYLKYQKFHRVHTHDNPCIDPTEHPSYSRPRCLEECFHYQIANRTNCTLPWLWLLPDDWLPQCSTVEQVSNLTSYFLQHNRRRLVADCHCPKSCYVTIYTPTIISRKTIETIEQSTDSHSFLAMYYANNVVTEMKEVVGYNINGFVSDIGGSLGFLLGLSVISFIAVVEKIICSVIKTYYKKKKTKAEDDQRSETQSDVGSNMSSSTKVMDDGLAAKSKRSSMNLYDNLNDFESDDFKYYQRTLVAESSTRF